ncbi:MAG: AraC family transcriptional regulator [Acidimicrobiales bacterium]|nr:AraC family transcriptional regulator [Hyphomonadaceae bacterium]RZV44067.1 MAG: AraC family transcriptional regulator [Acidimicrobiales bacterium]
MRTVSANYLKTYFDACLHLGVDKDALLEFIPGREPALNNRSSRFPVESVLSVLKTSENISGNKAVGVEAGKSFRPGTFENVGQALMVSQSLRHGSAIINRYQPLFQQIGRSYIVVMDDLAWNYWDTYLEDPEQARHVTEATLISHAQFGRWLTWQHEMPIEFVHFRHPKPHYHEIYDEIFKCPVYFDQPRDAVVFKASLVDIPFPQANQDQLEKICVKLDELMASLEAPKSYSEKTERCIYALLKSGAPDLSQTAEHIGVSPRSLRRHLADEGTSYRSVLEGTRRKLCEQYLLEQRIPLSEITERLGYSEQSAFNRAFKNWFGSTPKAYAKAMKVFDTAFDQMAP